MSLDLSSSFHQFRISMAGGSKNRIFAFDHFKLDSGRLMLYRDGSEVSIPPKVAKTLSVLVESAGTIITKDEVIERVWDDSIVEESNLTQYLYLLRKVLGNMPDGRPYIETLRRRGYRFNGEVVRVSDEMPAAKVATTRSHTDPAPQIGVVEREGNVLRVVDWKASDHAVETAAAETPAADVSQVTAEPLIQKKRSLIPRLAVASLALLLVAAGAVFLAPSLMPVATNADSAKELSVIRLTNGSTSRGATIAPDGNVFVYHETQGETNSLYVQQTGQASRIELASSAEQLYAGKAFSPDGQSIYYVAVDKKSRVPSLYRIPTMGGAPVLVLENVHGPISFSPDGKEFSFQRPNSVTGETSLLIADKNGRAERVVLQRKQPTQIYPSPAWSPGGGSIAFAEHDSSRGQTGSIRLYLLDIATGRVTPVSEERWDTFLRMVWTHDGTGIVMIGTRASEAYSTRRDQIYFVSYPGGVSRRITTEGNRHDPESLGITKRDEILAVPADRSSQVWVMSGDGIATSAVQLTRGSADGRSGLVVLPDGRFAYLARTADDINIMLSSPDGSIVKQIASGFQFVEELRVDPLGRYFVFSTMKDGNNHIFRADIDGGAAKQLTFGEGREIDSTISSDGKYMIYDDTASTPGNPIGYKLMRVPTEGGPPVELSIKGCITPTYSPDGSLISCVHIGDRASIVVASASDGAEIERHPLPVFSTWNFGIGWTPDGSGLVYIGTEKGVSNLWIQPRDGSKPRPLTNFSSGIIYRYAFAPDGSKLYVARGYPTQDAILIKNFR